MSYLNITASSSHPLEEPSYHVNPGSDTFDTMQVWEQLGATFQQKHARQILTITQADMDKSLAIIRGRPLLFNDHTEGQAYLASRAPLTGVNSLYMSPGSFEHGGIGNLTEAIVNIDPPLCSIFWPTPNEANSPARAIQAFRTT